MPHDVKVALVLFAGPAIGGIRKTIANAITAGRLQLPTDRPPEPAVAVRFYIIGIILTHKVLVWIGNVALVQHNERAGVVPAIVYGPAKVGLMTTDQEDVLRKQAWVGEDVAGD